MYFDHHCPSIIWDNQIAVSIIAFLCNCHNITKLRLYSASFCLVTLNYSLKWDIITLIMFLFFSWMILLLVSTLLGWYTLSIAKCCTPKWDKCVQNRKLSGWMWCMDKCYCFQWSTFNLHLFLHCTGANIVFNSDSVGLKCFWLYYHRIYNHWTDSRFKPTASSWSTGHKS